MIDSVTAGLAALLGPSDLVAGVDEAGRGSWAGPVAVGVAAVAAKDLEKLLCERWVKEHLDDSKGLSPAWRESLLPLVERHFFTGFGIASAGECDDLGMTAALHRAAERAFASLGLAPRLTILDGKHDYLARPGVVTLVKGDSRSAPVAAASLVAKVGRDSLMREAGLLMPAWGFATHKGYGSRAHETALIEYGLSAIHRRSWGYVKRLGLGADE
ncbi:MAG: ribonuclease HII [Actinomycetota bacterium]|nr:ribonuclease HII [Actinomycetota bacterium]